jgi:polysaccharide pyruvyl transferase WcaK-like protein
MFYLSMKINSHLAIPEKHILIVGNRSYKNLGDEMILLWTVKLLLNKWKKITIAAYDTEWIKTFFSQCIDISKITFITEIPKGFRSWWKYIITGKLKEWKLWRKANTVIIGWGEIITEENKHSYRYRLASIIPLLIGGQACLKKPRYLMGWIQPPKKLFNRFLFKKILKRTKHIFARDLDTVHDMKTYGFHNVEFFMDTSYFAYDRKKNRKRKKNTKKS